MNDTPVATKTVSLRAPTEYRDMGMVRRRNPIFFASELMSQFGTLIESPVHKTGLFITSDKPDGLEMERAYTVRRAVDLYDTRAKRYVPNVINVAKGFMAYTTLAKAQNALEAYQTLLLLRGRPLLRGMSAAVQGASGFTALQSATGGFTLICADHTHIMEVQKHGEDYQFEQELCRIDFRSTDEARRALAAGSEPIDDTWISNIVSASRGIPIGPVAAN